MFVKLTLQIGEQQQQQLKQQQQQLIRSPTDQQIMNFKPRVFPKHRNTDRFTRSIGGGDVRPRGGGGGGGETLVTTRHHSITVCRAERQTEVDTVCTHTHSSSGKVCELACMTQSATNWTVRQFVVCEVCVCANTVK